MKTFAVPVAYYIYDDNDVSLEVFLIRAEDKTTAIKEVKDMIIGRELKELLDNSGNENVFVAFNEIPAIWVEGEDGDEEGYIIAKEENIKEL